MRTFNLEIDTKHGSEYTTSKAGYYYCFNVCLTELEREIAKLKRPFTSDDLIKLKYFEISESITISVKYSYSERNYIISSWNYISFK